MKKHYIANAASRWGDETKIDHGILRAAGNSEWLMETIAQLGSLVII